MASSALVSDISGVCRSGETRRITANPMNAASMHTYKLDNKSSFTASRSLPRRQGEELAHAGVYNFAAMRQQRLAVDFVRFVNLCLSVFD